MDFKFRAVIPKLDPEKATKLLRANLNKLMFEAAKSGLRAMLANAVGGRGIPIWTGMSRGTLRPLGRYLGMRIPIGTIDKKKKRRGRSPATGARLAYKSPYIFDTPKGIKFEFGFSNLMRNGKDYHFYLNELKGTHVPGTPWNAFKVMRDEMKRYIDSHDPFPGLNDFLTWSQIK